MFKSSQLLFIECSVVTESNNLQPDTWDLVVIIGNYAFDSFPGTNLDLK